MMRPTKNQINFLRSLARSTTGDELIKYLEEVEKYYSDIRNLEGTSAETRIDSLKIIRESILDKLITMKSDSTSPTDGEEYT